MATSKRSVSNDDSQKSWGEYESEQNISAEEADTAFPDAGSQWGRGCLILLLLLLTLCIFAGLFAFTGYRLAQSVWQDEIAALPAMATSTITSTPLAMPNLPPTPIRTPVIIITPTVELAAAPGQVLPTALPAATPTVPPTATAMPTPTYTPDPGILPSAEVISGTVLLRAAPGFEQPVVAVWGPGIPLAVKSQTLDGGWLQVCCVQTATDPEGALWLPHPNEQVRITGEGNLRLYATPISVPTPLAILTPFARARGPEFYQNEPNLLAIEVKVYVGQPPSEQALAGYLLAVEFHPTNSTVIEKRLNQDQQQVSRDGFSTGYGGAPFNYKFEYRGDLGTGTWRLWLTNAEGYNLWLNNDPAYKLQQLSDEIIFTTAPGKTEGQIYLAWIRVG